MILACASPFNNRMEFILTMWIFFADKESLI